MTMRNLLSDIKMVPIDGAQSVDPLFRINGKPIIAEHTGKVADTCASLARRFGQDETAARTAAMLHDVGGLLPPERMLEHALSHEWELDEAEKRYPFLLHQRFSALLAKELFGIADDSILEAISCHTTLRAQATQLDMLLFLADKISWDQGGEPPFLNVIQQGLEQSLRQASHAYLRYVLDGGTLLHPHRWLLEAATWLEETNKTS